MLVGMLVAGAAVTREKREKVLTSQLIDPAQVLCDA